MGWIKRLRHGRGFGVHSPFAFRFITEVLRETLPYYDYSQLHGRGEELFYRVACYFRPHTIAAPQRFLQIALMASPDSTPCAVEDADFVVFDNNPGPQAVISLINDHRILYFTFKHDKELMAAIDAHLTEINYGMVFDDEHDTAIIVCTPKLPHQTFTAKF